MALYGENSVFAWAHTNLSSTQNIVDSYNVSSLTDNGAGRTRVNFATNATNNDYALACSAGNRNGTTTASRTQNLDGALNVAHCSIRNFIVNGSTDTPTDDSFVSIFIISDN